MNWDVEARGIGWHPLAHWPTKDTLKIGCGKGSIHIITLDIDLLNLDLLHKLNPFHGKFKSFEDLYSQYYEKNLRCVITYVKGCYDSHKSIG